MIAVCAVSWQAQRRLAQNREAARKSRMRKKVIIPYGKLMYILILLCMAFHPVFLLTKAWFSS